MAEQKIDTVENRWDILYRDFPEVYDEFANVPNEPTISSVIFQKFNFVDKAVVDIGSGTGKSSFEAAGYASHVTGIEPEEAMRNLAYAKAKELNLTNVEFLAGTAEEVPLPNASTDIVLAITAAIHPPDRFALFAQEALRVVRPGGYIISVGVAPGWYGGDLTPVILGPQQTTECDTEGISDKIFRQDFGFDYEDVDSTQDYGSLDKILRTYGFIFGRKAMDYLRKHNKTTIQWKSRIHFKRV